MKNLKNLDDLLVFTVRENDEGKRLDQFLAEVYPEFSRNYFQKLIKSGFVEKEGIKIKKASKKVKKNEQYTVYILEPEPLEVKPENIPLDIYYEDEDIAVVYKPAGMVVHPSPGHTSGTLVNALLYHFKKVSTFGGKERAGIVHRLDKDTSGLLVVAKTEFAHKELQKQFQEKSVDKRYKTIVTGKTDKYGKIDLPIGRSIYDRKKMGTVSTKVRDALTEYWLEFYDEKSNLSFLDVKIHTGRTHQIRVHLSSIGHPVLNDRVYGFKQSSVKDNLLKNILKEIPFHFLVAYKLGFKHPRTGRQMEIELKEFPDYFKVVLDTLKGRDKALKQPRED